MTCPYCGQKIGNTFEEAVSKALLWIAVLLGSLGVGIAIRLLIGGTT